MRGFPRGAPFFETVRVTAARRDGGRIGASRNRLFAPLSALLPLIAAAPFLSSPSPAAAQSFATYVNPTPTTLQTSVPTGPCALSGNPCSFGGGAPISGQNQQVAPSLTVTPTPYGAVSCGPASLTTTCTVPNWGASGGGPYSVSITNNANALGSSFGQSPYNIWYVDNNSTLKVTVNPGYVSLSGGSAQTALDLDGVGASHNWVNSTDYSSETDNSQAEAYDNTPMLYTTGPNLTLNVQSGASIAWTNGWQAFNLSGALDVTSFGALGTQYGDRNVNGYTDPNGPPWSGSVSPYDGGVGGGVTVDFAGQLTATGTATAASNGQPIMPMFAGVGAYSFGSNGTGYDNNNSCCAGNGGYGGPVSVTSAAGSSIIITSTLSNVPAVGVEAVSLGGVAAFEHYDLGTFIGQSGAGGSVTVDSGGTVVVTGGSSGAIGVLAASLGGPGTTYDSGYTVTGAGGAVSVTQESTGSITATGAKTGVGVAAFSLPGANPPNYEGNSGSVTVVNNGAITTGNAASPTSGVQSFGILAVSGGAGSVIGLLSGNSFGSTSGSGQGGAVNVTNNGTINSAGTMAAGVAAVSAGGAGAAAGGGGNSTLGNWGTYYAGRPGTVTVANAGSITTLGTAAYGVAAESLGGVESVTVASATWMAPAHAVESAPLPPPPPML